MPPRRWKKESITRLVEKHMAKAIEEYKRSKANLDSARSSGGNTRNTGGTVNVQSYSHKTFMNGKPHSFNGTEGVVGLRYDDDYGILPNYRHPKDGARALDSDSERR
ncbi:hypothetical protein Tco_0615429 [Tanacetum coccineum]